MSTWRGVLVATAGRVDFWSVAERQGIVRATEATPPHALIECDADGDAPMRLAESLSRELSTMAIGFSIQTNVDTHHAQVFVNGASVRYLGYDREGTGWARVEGAPQIWERVYFFDNGSTREGGGKDWPRMLDEEISEEECERYEAAKAAGDASPILSMLGPSSTAPMWEVCESFGAKPDMPSGRWKKPSLWSRWFGQGPCAHARASGDAK